MVITLHCFRMSNTKILKKYALNNTRAKRIKNKYLVTTNSGSFIALSEKEYFNLIHSDFDENLFKKLEEKGIIITEDNEQKIIGDFRKKNDFLFQGASLHIVIVTLRCNQICTYCQASRKPMDAMKYDMDKETAKKTVDFIFQSPSDAITIEFQGGEPLLNFPVVKFIVEYANKLNKKHKKDLVFSIVTNLTIMTDNILDFLVKNKVGLCTSLDGPKSLHDKNRKYINGKGSYNDVIKGIKKIRQKKSLDKDYQSIPNSLTTITKYSLNKHREIVDEYVNQRFHKIWFRCMTRLGCASSVWDELGYRGEEFVEFYKKGIDYIVKNKIPIRERMATIILKKILNKKDPGFLDLRSPCGAAIGQLAYNHDGSIYSCDEGRMVGEIFKLGTVEQSYKEVLSSDETCSLIGSSVNDIYLCDNCVFKPYCGVCPVCNYAEQGNLIPKLPKDMRCKIYKGVFSFIFEKLLFDEGYREVFLKWSKSGR